MGDELQVSPCGDDYYKRDEGWGMRDEIRCRYATVHVLCRQSFAWRLTVVSRPYGPKTPVRLRSRRASGVSDYKNAAQRTG